MDTEREIVDGGLLSSQIKDSDLGIRNTTAVSGLNVWSASAVSVAARWSLITINKRIPNIAMDEFKIYTYEYHSFTISNTTSLFTHTL